MATTYPASSVGGNPFAINLGPSYNPASGSPTQFNVGRGPVMVPGQNTAAASVTGPGATPWSNPAYYSSSGAYIGPTTFQGGRPASANPAGRTFQASLMGGQGANNANYLTDLLRGSGTGPVSFSDRKTLENIKDRMGFNTSIGNMLGMTPWGQQGMQRPPEETVWQGNAGGNPGRPSAGQMAWNQSMYQQGFHQMPNPGTLDPNDYRFKQGGNTWGEPNSMIYPMDGSNSVWVRGTSAGSQRDAPIRGY